MTTCYQSKAAVERFLVFSLALHAGSEITRTVRIDTSGPVPSYYVGGKLKMEVRLGLFSTATFFRGGRGKGGKQTTVFLMDNEVQDIEVLQRAFEWAVGLKGGISYKRVLELMLEAQPEQQAQ